MPMPAEYQVPWYADFIDTWGVAHNLDGTHKATLISTWDYLIFNDAGTYRARDRYGITAGSNSNLQALVMSLMSSGVHIHFDIGTYTLTSAIAPTVNDVRFSGKGRLTSITRTGTGNAFEFFGSSGSYLYGCTIENMQINGTSIGTEQVVGSGVYGNYVEELTVRDMWINGFGSQGDDAAIRLNWAKNCHVIENRCWNSKNGICTGAPSTTDIRTTDSEFIRNWCWNNYDDGLHGQRGARNVWNGNVAWGHPAEGGASDGAGMDLLGEEHSVVMYNILHSNGRGLESGNSANVNKPNIGCVYSHNIIVNNTAYGLAIIAATERETFSYNIVEDNASGIRFGTGTAGQYMSDIEVSHNQIHNNGSLGIDVFGQNIRPIIESNKISGHSTADITVRVSGGNPPTDYAIIDNVLRSTTGLSDTVSGAGRIIRNLGD